MTWMPKIRGLLPAALVAAAALSLSYGDAQGGEGAALPALPGPAPRPRALQATRLLNGSAEGSGKASASDVQQINEQCASCHAEIADEWRASMHKGAWVDPVFQKAYAIENVAFCRGCHAPEANPASEPGAAEQAVGVACTTCHVQEEGSIVGARAAPAGAAPHPVFVDARLSTTKACVGCHQFNFPGEKMPMQDTANEHARSSFATSECQACHMPMAASSAGAKKKPHRSHRFAVLGDAAMIQSAAKVSASRSSGRMIEVTVAAGAVGHSFPTGDMFRRLEVRAEAVDEANNVVARAEPVFLGRTFIDRPRDNDAAPAFHRTEGSDTRVPPPGAGPPRVAGLSFSKPVGDARVRWRVLYQRMGSAMAASFGVNQAIDEVVVAEGVLPPFSSSSDR